VNLKKIWEVREFSTVVILALEILFFTWYLWPDGSRSHPFFNAPNFVLIFKYSAIYGIAAVGAAIVIISGGIDLAPGAVMALSGVVASQLFVERGWGLGTSMTTGVLVGLVSGLVTSVLVVVVKLPPFIATLGMMVSARGLSRWWSNGNPVSFPTESFAGISNGGSMTLCLALQTPDFARAYAAVVSSVQAYDLTAPTATWTTEPSLPLARHGLAVAAISNTLYAIGGSTQPGHTASTNTVDALTFS